MALSLREQLRKGFQANAAGKVDRAKETEDSSKNGDTIGVSKGDARCVTKGDTGDSRGVTFGVTNGVTNGDSTRYAERATKGDAITHSKGVPNSVPIERFRSVNEARTKSEKALWKFLTDHPKIVISRNDLSEEIRVPESTLEKVLRRWAERGWLLKNKAPGNEGMILEFLPGGDTSGDTFGDSNGDSKKAPLKIDRENLSISLSAERIAMTWPSLDAAGFGPSQIDQIVQALSELGKPSDKIVQSLDHAEWELGHGKMLDKDGQPVADPCSWVFRSLARTGYYRRPKGYVSAEEQAARDAEAEAKAVTAARQAAEQEKFEAWRDGLSPEELADAMRGHPGGPKDAWLKRVWKSNQDGRE